MDSKMAVCVPSTTQLLSCACSVALPLLPQGCHAMWDEGCMAEGGDKTKGNIRVLNFRTFRENSLLFCPLELTFFTGNISKPFFFSAIYGGNQRKRRLLKNTSMAELISRSKEFLGLTKKPCKQARYEYSSDPVTGLCNDEGTYTGQVPNRTRGYGIFNVYNNMHLLLISRYPAARNCFQKTRYLPVRSQYLLSPRGNFAY